MSVLYVCTILIWGTTWFPIQLSLGVVAPEISVVYRLAIATVVLFIWCHYRRLSLSFTIKQHLLIIFFGICLYAVDLTLLYEGSRYLSSGVVAITFSTIVIFNIINKRIFLKEPISAVSIFGVLVGITGLCIAFWPDISTFGASANEEKSGLLGLVLVLGGALAGSFGNIASIALQKDQVGVTQGNAFGMLYGCLALCVFAFLKGTPFTFDTSATYLGSLVYLAIFGSVLAFGFYLTLVGQIGADKAAYANLIFPVIAVFISTVFEGFVLDVRLLVAFSFLLFGNYLMHIKPKWLFR